MEGMLGCGHWKGKEQVAPSPVSLHAAFLCCDPLAFLLGINVLWPQERRSTWAPGLWRGGYSAFLKPGYPRA